MVAAVLLMPPVVFIAIFDVPLPLVVLLLFGCVGIGAAGFAPRRLCLERYERGFVYRGYFGATEIAYDDLVTVTSMDPFKGMSAQGAGAVVMATMSGEQPMFWGRKGRLLWLDAAQARAFQPVLDPIIDEAVPRCVARAQARLDAGQDYVSPAPGGGKATSDALHGVEVAVFSAKPKQLAWGEIETIDAEHGFAKPEGGAAPMSVRGVAHDLVLREVAFARTKAARKRKSR